ncbi:sugar-binding transcriptional regulator [Nakamurella endophytica]|uniref:sugar-binding transcriptional regulator n=1 Tax=Nakamurella endophytica TaxID=1748367 RepID=UPI00166F4456|nr:sugar-binding domain-containing protein [Nakamurella endophytica]
MARVRDTEVERLVTTVAWLYHTKNMRQSAIAERLGISQSRVSRLLDQAVSMGIVRTIVVLPDSAHSVLESELESAYGLREAHVYDLGDTADDAQLVRELGQLLALHLQSSPLDAEVIGLTSWSRSLGETVRSLQPVRTSTARTVVEMLGDVGPPRLQHEAAQVTQQLAHLTGASPMFLRIPGVTPSPEVRRTLLEHNPHAREALRMLDQVELALVGIGAGRIVPPLQGGENFFTAEQFERARAAGAVAEINLRFIAEDGSPVVTELDELVVGATLEQVRRAERRLGVAGGPAKYRSIRAALLGGWVNCLVTDSRTARYLIEHR